MAILEIDCFSNAPFAEVNGEYVVKRPLKRSEVLKFARSLLAQQFQDQLLTPAACKAFIHKTLPFYEVEVFFCIFLDNANRVIKVSELFRGTINRVFPYKRELVEKIIEQRASAVMFAHNHSTNSRPSASDIKITKELRDLLKVINVRLLDHFIVTADDMVSMLELGLI